MEDQIIRLKMGNTRSLWKSIGPSLYTKRPLFSITLRELLQNSADAQKAKGIDIDSPIIFDLSRTVDTNDWTLVCSDKGTGMDTKIIHDKFLALGESGKSDADSTGGFGIAKASILGACSRWSIKTLDSYFDSSMLDVSPIKKVEDPISGTSVTLFFDGKEEVKGLIPDRYAVQEALGYLATSNVPSVITISTSDNQKIETKMTGLNVDQKFKINEFSQGRTKAVLSLIPVIKIKHLDPVGYYSPREDDYTVSGKVIYRLNGLTQYMAYISSNPAEFNVVVDVTTEERPGSMDYPFTSSREEASAWLKAKVQEICHPIFTNYLTSASRLRELTGEKVVITKKSGSTLRQPKMSEGMVTAKARSAKETREEKINDNNRKLEVALTTVLGSAPKSRSTYDSFVPSSNEARPVSQKAVPAVEVAVEESQLAYHEDGGIKTMIRYLEGQKIIDVTKGANVKLLALWTEIMDILMDCNRDYVHPFGVGVVTDSDVDAMRCDDNDGVYYLFNTREMKVSDPMNTVMNMVHFAAHELAHTKHYSHTEGFCVAYHKIYENFLLKRGIKTIYALSRQLREGFKLTE